MFNEDKMIGDVMLEKLRGRPDAVCQIDASTGEEETNASVLKRSVHLARWFRSRGLKPGDVLALCGKNHLDLAIPYLAALFNGLPITGIDPSYKLVEVRNIFKVIEPKIAFCEPESYNDYVQAAKDLGLATDVYTFGKGEHSMQKILETFKDDSPVEEFEVAKFDTSKVYVWLVTSGGTTGVMKVAAISHDALKYKLGAMMFGMFGKVDRSAEPHIPVLHLASVQWISSTFNMMGTPVLHQTRVQTSAPVTPEHVIDMINKYKPTATMFSPALASGILKSEKECDLSCLRTIVLTGGKVYEDILKGLKERSKTTLVMEAYGQTENLGPVFIPNPMGPIGNCGKAMPGAGVKLVNPETGKEITEPNVPGELWTKGVCFSGYYNNPEETAEAFTEDGWFKTGDLLYRDTENNFYFVERLKMLIKYRNYHIVPPELEALIRAHPGVADVSVTSVPHHTDGEHAVACVVKRNGANVTAEEIEELVASQVSDTKKLRGGVVFLDKLPFTHAGKVARGKLREIVLNTRKTTLN